MNSIKFIDDLQYRYERQLRSFQLEDQYLILCYWFTNPFGIGDAIGRFETSGINAKIIPSTPLERDSLHSIFHEKNLDKDIETFISLLSDQFPIRFLLMEDILNNKENLDSIINYDSIYLSKNASWTEFKNWIRNTTEQIYIKNKQKFSDGFFDVYLKFMNYYFKEYGPKEKDVDFSTAKIKSRWSKFSAVRTLQNYQSFLRFKNLVGQRSYGFYWDRMDGKKFPHRLDKFNLIFATKFQGQCPSVNDLLIYYDNQIYIFGYGSENGLNKNCTNLLKECSLSNVLRYLGVSSLIAFSKK